MSDDQMQLEEVQPESTTDETSQVPDDWNSLDGKSQDRFQSLANKKKEAEKLAKDESQKREKLEIELKTLKDAQRVPMPSRTKPKMSQEEETAYKRMTEIGVANQEYVDKKVDERVRAIEDRIYFDNLHTKLEDEIKSKKGYPSYDRSEIESYMKAKQIFDPKAAYRDLYYDEIVATEATKNKSNKNVTTEKTASRIGSQSPWTKQAVQDRLNQPDGKQWFIKNRDKLLKMQGSLS